MAIKVVKSGLSTTVQDLGRPGYYHIGIPTSGGMDLYALRAANLLVGIVDRHRRDPEHLIAAGAAHRIDGAEATAVADRQFRRIGARSQIFRRLDLPFALHHLIEERQARDEADHRDEPRGAGMRLHETLDAVEMVDGRGIFDVGLIGRLVPIAEAHQRLTRPGIIVEHRNFDDAGRQMRHTRARLRFDCLQLGEQVVGLDHVWIKFDLEGGVGRANLGHAANLRLSHGLGDGKALEEGLERHFLVAFDEDVLVASIGISRRHRSLLHDAARASQSSSQRV